MKEAPSFTSKIQNLQSANGRQDDRLESGQLHMEVSIPAGQTFNPNLVLTLCRACLTISCNVQEQIRKYKANLPVTSTTVHRFEGHVSAPVGVLSDDVRNCRKS